MVNIYSDTCSGIVTGVYVANELSRNVQYFKYFLSLFSKNHFASFHIAPTFPSPKTET